MKKPILLAALLAFASPALANPTPNLNITVGGTGSFTTNADTGIMSTQPSTVQYNSSQGQNNNFAVGANTSFGVNASSASTPDYSVTSVAVLNSGALGTTLVNQIGTSGTAQASQQWAQQAGSFASSFTSELVNSAISKAEVNGKYGANGGWEYKQDDGSTKTYTSKGAWEAEYEASYKQTNEYKTAYSQAYNQSYANASSGGQSSSTAAAGTISGSFQSSTGGNASNSSSASSSASARETLYVKETDASNTVSYRAATEAELTTGKVNGTGASFFVAGAKSVDANSGVESSTYTAASTSQVAAAAAAAANAQSSTESTNKVVVTGIGSDSKFTSSDKTNFNVGIASNLGKVNGDTTSVTAIGVSATNPSAAETGSKLILLQGSGAISSSATANGSAMGSFGTNSTASSNSATYTSVFFQAF